MCDKKRGDDKNMAVAESVKVDIQETIVKSLREVDEIRNGRLPKRSYKEMIERVKHKLNEEGK